MNEAQNTVNAFAEIEGNHIPQEKRDSLWNTFDHFDFDRDGYINKRELHGVLHYLDPLYWTEHGGTVDKLWNHLDRNGDGFIDFTEFVQWTFDLDSHSVTSSKAVIAAYFRGMLNKVDACTRIEAAAATAAKEATAKGYSVEFVAAAAGEAVRLAGGSTAQVAKTAGTVAAREAKARGSSASVATAAAKAAAEAAGASLEEAALAAGRAAAECAKMEGKCAQAIAKAAGDAAKAAGCEASAAAMVASNLAAEYAETDGKSGADIAQAGEDAVKAVGGSVADVMLATGLGARSGRRASAPATVNRMSDADMLMTRRSQQLPRSSLGDIDRANEDHVKVLGKFHHFDANQDGFIDAHELKRVLQALDPHWTEGELRKLFRYVDANEDGKIEYAELFKWCFLLNDGSGKGFMGKFHKTVAQIE